VLEGKMIVREKLGIFEFSEKMEGVELSDPEP
jgi:hypothetical protein